MISIIIPTFNEAKNITDLVERLKKSLINNYELIIIDDASLDGTGALSEKLARDYPIKVVHRTGKLGLSSAVMEGFKVASGELLCVMDSDLSHPPEVVPLLLKRLEEHSADIVIGSRFAKGGMIVGWPKRRLISTRLALLSVWPLTRVKDPMSGFFILRRDVIRSAPLVPRGFKILLEILVKGKCKKAEEYPIIFKDRVHGVSKLDSKVYLEFLTQLWDLYLYRFLSLFKARQ